MIANEIDDRTRPPASGPVNRNAPIPEPRTRAAALVDRRTATLHRINGTTVTLHTQTSDLAVATLFPGRDRSVQSARIQPIELEHRR